MLCRQVCTIPQFETLDYTVIVTGNLLLEPPNTVPAAVGTALSLLGSLQNGQTVLSVFQKCLLCWECIHSFSHCGHFWNRKWLAVCAQCFPSYQLASLPPCQQLASTVVATILTISPCALYEPYSDTVCLRVWKCREWLTSVSLFCTSLCHCNV
jgi:hypothetical protein